MRGTEVTARHNMVAKGLADLFESSGSHTHLEPRYRHDAERNPAGANGSGAGSDARYPADRQTDIPDITVYPPTADAFDIDVTFVNTLAPSYLRSKPATLLAARERAKHTHYRRHEAASGQRLVAFALTTTGGLSGEAAGLTTRLAGLLTDGRSWENATSASVRSFLHTRISCQAVNALGVIAQEWRRAVAARLSPRAGRRRGDDAAPGASGVSGAGAQAGGLSLEGLGGRGGSAVLFDVAAIEADASRLRRQRRRA